MFAGVLSALSGIGRAFSAFFNMQSNRDLMQAGVATGENKTLNMHFKISKEAREIDERPMDKDPHNTINRL